MCAHKIDKVVRWEDGKCHYRSDSVAIEEPLEIRVRGRAISVTMRTPGHDDELAAGFLFTEGIIHRANDILNLEPCVRNEFGNLINVQLAPDVHVDFEKLTRHVFASSSCGLCGKATIEAVNARFDPISNLGSPQVKSSDIARLPDIMRSHQRTFDETGGLHACALFTSNAELLVLREDVGRHNAVDKVLGYAFLKKLMPLDNHILLVSGRTSFEIMQKTLAGRLPILAGVSAPSSLAVEFAAENHQTLIGFLRGTRMNVYSGFDRITG